MIYNPFLKLAITCTVILARRNKCNIYLNINMFMNECVNENEVSIVGMLLYKILYLKDLCLK